MQAGLVGPSVDERSERPGRYSSRFREVLMQRHNRRSRSQRPLPYREDVTVVALTYLPNRFDPVSMLPDCRSIPQNMSLSALRKLDINYTSDPKASWTLHALPT